MPGRLPATFRPEQEYWQHEAQWARERTPLYAMQAALCKRAIEQWDAVQGTLPGSDGQAHIYSADEKAHYVAALKKEIAERNQTKKAVYEEVVVPWLPAPSGWEGFDAEQRQGGAGGVSKEDGGSELKERRRVRIYDGGGSFTSARPAQSIHASAIGCKVVEHSTINHWLDGTPRRMSEPDSSSCARFLKG